MKDILSQIKNDIITYRRDFHKHPETGWTEIRTASIIAKKLNELGYEIQIGKEVIKPESRMGLPSQEELDVEYERALSQGAPSEYAKEVKDGFTGVVGTLKFGDGPTLALRFDIDALKISETKDSGHIPNLEGFSSMRQGIMHACGHDTHAAIGLGVAELIVRMAEKTDFKGTIKLLFQPAEEGVRGAKCMVDAGVLDGVDYVIAGHMKATKSGQLICAYNGYMATTKLDVEYTGLPAHAGGAPNEGRNAMLAACTAVLNINAIPRHGKGASRVNIGTLQSGSDRNIIADKSFMKLELRGETDEINQYMEEYVYRILKSSADMHNVNCKIEKVGSAPSAKCSTNLAKSIRDIGQSLGIFEEIIEVYDKPGGSEDFMYMMNEVQDNGGEAVYFIVGSDKISGHHTSEFDIHEDDMMNAIYIYGELITELLA